MRITNGIKVKRSNTVTVANGLRFKKNNVITTVWVANTPYTVNFTDYPITEVSSTACAHKSIDTTASYYRVSALKGDTTTFANLVASVTLPTQKCNKVRVKYTASEYAGGSINGTEVTSGATDELVFDCSGDEFTLTLSVSDNTAYYTATLTVTEVSFYYESV